MAKSNVGPEVEITKSLSQEELAELFQAQQKGDWPKIQESQARLKATMVNKYEQNWQEYHQKYPQVKPVFDLSDKAAQSFRVTAEIADLYNLKGHLSEFDKKSDASTAGIRAFVDLLHSENPSMMYNDLFLAILIEAETEFLKEVHKEIRENLLEIEKNDPGFNKFVKNLRRKINIEVIAVIEQIYEMPLEQIIPYVRDNIVKLIGGEVRVHTAKFIELEARIQAERGITMMVPEKYSDSAAIFIYSFLVHLLGATGGTHYTSSHSANYMAGRKVLAPGGAQLLPDKYEAYRQILRRIIEKDIYGGDGYTLKLSSADHPKIKRTLSYQRMAKLYRSILNISQKDISLINLATEEGHRIVLNCLNGSMWKTLEPLLSELEIRSEVFELVYEEEDPYFEVGYIVTCKDEDNQKTYGVDHLGVDTTMQKVAQTIPYREILKGKPNGIRVYECDPDSDRFSLKQILSKSKEADKFLTDFGVDAYDSDNNRVLVAPTPNKVFLLLDIADYEHLKKISKWDKYYSAYIITYASTRAWAEFADSVEGMVRIMTRVGFKNVSEMQQVIESWYYDEPDQMEFEFKDQLGREIKFDRQRKIRIHAKEEESGGRVAGMDKDCYNILGQNTLAMPEKSSADSLLSELLLSSKLFLENKGREDGYLINEYIEKAFSKYRLHSKIDLRLDILHGDQGEIAQMPYRKQQEALSHSQKIKANFNNFFFSLGKAVRDKQVSIEKAREILCAILPQFNKTWECLSEITLTEEPLSGGRTRPEGVPMIFKAVGLRKPLVTELDFRPSGTDPLKSKIYLDSEALSLKAKQELESKLSALQQFDLYQVLSHFQVKSIEPETSAVKGLKKLI